MNLVTQVYETRSSSLGKLLITSWGKIHHMRSLISQYRCLLQHYKGWELKRGSRRIFTREYTAFPYFALCDDADWCNSNSSQSNLFARRNFVHST